MSAVKTVGKALPRLKQLLTAARAGIARVSARVRGAMPRAAGVIKQAATTAAKSRTARWALGAAAIGGGVGLGAYWALSGLGAGQAYAQYATEAAQVGEVPPAPPPLPWDLGGGLFEPPPGGEGAPVGVGATQRALAFFTSPFVLFILLIFVLVIVGLYAYFKWRK